LEQELVVYSSKGIHITFDLWGLKSEMLNNNIFLKNLYIDAIEKCGAEILQYQENLFEPEGLTFTFILSESHASCHTYPKEYGNGCLMGCIHTCGEHVDPNIAVDYIVKVLRPTKVNKNIIIRGVEPQ
jgi:S-adenosylmethionine decarboxylase